MNITKSISRQSLKRAFYALKHSVHSPAVVVLVILGILVFSWIMGSVSVMQRNYTLQRTLLLKQREQSVAELEVKSLEYKKAYFESNEYQELAAREQFGLGRPGERVLILPKNSQEAIIATQNADQRKKQQPTMRESGGNIDQWLNFLSGNNARDLRL